MLRELKATSAENVEHKSLKVKSRGYIVLCPTSDFPSAQPFSRPSPSFSPLHFSTFFKRLHVGEKRGSMHPENGVEGGKAGRAGKPSQTTATTTRSRCLRFEPRFLGLVNAILPTYYCKFPPGEFLRCKKLHFTCSSGWCWAVGAGGWVLGGWFGGVVLSEV